MLNSYEIDKKLEPVLRSIEKNGVKLDVDLLKRMSSKLDKKIAILINEINKEFKEEINLNSPSQLAEVLYKKLQIKPRESGIKYKKRHFSTSAQSLEKIKNKYPIVKKILQYRELVKLKNTYVDPLPKQVDENNRIHTHYAIDTSTGRFSSKNPNLQNIPVRTELGKEIRRAFIAENGKCLIKADYSQIELRIMAHMAHDEAMIKIFKEGHDIHTQTGEEMGCDRRMAKVVNFGVLYGMSAYGLADTLKISVEEAQFFIDKYFITFSNVKKFIDYQIKEATDKGYAKTMFGRKREILELKSPNKYLRSFGARAAVNTPIQGSAAEIIKLAMLKLADKCNQENTDIKMILQVHDELVFEVSKDMVQEAVKIIKNSMEQAAKLDVPLLVEIQIGNNWQDMQKIRTGQS